MRLPCLFLLVLLSQVGLSDCLGSDLTERFQAEAPVGWQALREFSRSSRGIMQEATMPGAGKVKESNPWKLEYRWNCLAGNERLDIAFEEGDEGFSGSSNALVLNREYGFIVNRRSQAKDYAIRSLTNPSAIRGKVDRYQVEAIGLKVDAESADQIALDPSFHILNVQSHQDGDQERVTVDFDCNVSHRPDYVVKSGQFVFIPSLKWAVASYVLTIEYPDVPGNSRGGYEYSSQTLDGIPIPTRHFCDRTDVSEKSCYLHIENTFSEIGYGTATEEECRLAAFGLPEVTERIGTSSWRNVLLLVNAGIVLMALGLFLRRRNDTAGTVAKAP